MTQPGGICWPAQTSNPLPTGKLSYRLIVHTLRSYLLGLPHVVGSHSSSVLIHPALTEPAQTFSTPGGAGLGVEGSGVGLGTRTGIGFVDFGVSSTTLTGV